MVNDTIDLLVVLVDEYWAAAFGIYVVWFWILSASVPWQTGLGKGMV